MRKIYINTLSILFISGSALSLEAQSYVNISASGNNDGSSWSDAYNDLQDAINNATSGDEIWIAAGTYFPTEDINGSSSPADPKDVTFHWSGKELTIYGGFNGTETSLSQRDIQNNEVILSGDIGSVGDFMDNVKTILTISSLSSNSTLDGVTISDATALGGNQGSFYISNVNGMSFENCTIANNAGSSQGSSWIGNSDVFFRNCIFHNNSASEGGTSYISYSDVIIEGCTFYGNTSGAHSGNLTFNGAGSGNASISSSVIVNSLFYENIAGTLSGGAMFFYNVSTGAEIINCTFVDNSVSTGANGYSIGSNGVSLDISNCIFWNTGTTTQYEVNETNSNYGLLNISNSIVKNGTSVGNVTNVLDTDPLFSDASNYDFTLANNSPALGAADSTGISNLIPVVDLAGNNRYAAGIDMGCYENQVPLSIENEKIKFDIYPNPANDHLFISHDLKSGMISIIDLAGQVVVKEMINNRSTLQLNLPSGIYLVKIDSNNSSAIQKLVIE